MKNEVILPDEEAYRWVRRNHPNCDPTEMYRLAQAYVILRLSGAELLHGDGLTLTEGAKPVAWKAIRDHNRKVRASGFCW